jgi:DNA repair protein RadC
VSTSSIYEVVDAGERCRRWGPSALSAAELLALVLTRGGSRRSALELARSVLARFGDLRHLSRAEVRELTKLDGIGAARSVTLGAAFELGRRVEHGDAESLELIEGPESAARLLRTVLGGLKQEGVAVLHLGARHQVLRVQLVALGTLNAASVEAREIFRGAIAVAAAAIVLGHNHPSGSPEPSQDDLRLTRRIAGCGETLGVTLLDHLVLGEGSYVSLRERGAL